MDRITAWRGYPAKIRMDNGPVLTSVKIAKWAEEHGVELEFIQPGKPTQNAYVERFNQTYRDEILDFYVFKKNQKYGKLLTDGWKNIMRKNLINHLEI
jgi:putative transposase